EGIKKNPDFAAARLALGRWYLSSSMFTEAKKEFSEITAKCPDNVFAHKGLAGAYKGLGNTDDAVEEYKKVLRLNPLDKEATDYLESRGVEIRTAGIPSDKEPHDIALPAPAETQAAVIEAEEQEAERLIAEGRYKKALEIYEGMLSSRPNEAKILQRKEELISLIKFMGKDKENIIKRLSRFLDAVKTHFARRAPLSSAEDRA
ncbi:MAG: tetratricopeptide repeat protein, partial [Nitrospirae bacterium]|nr:tetratricopeptide repeat protein [Nitrospirota bacterium]